MADFPAAGYVQDATRTAAQQKAALEAFLAATKQLPGAGGAVSTLTIASGSVTPTAGEHIVDTEAAAVTDDLANIAQTNIPDGRLLMLRGASATRGVVVKHGAGGAGQVAIADAADFSLLDPTMWLALRRDGALWTEVFRSYGNQGAALRTRYDLASLAASPNTFTKTQQWAQGANIASAATLALGTDGNRFLVTGVLGITAISAKPVGTRILLEFAGTAALTHHASNLKLQNAQPFTASPGDELELVSIGSGQWKEINRHLAIQSTGFISEPETAQQVLWEDFIRMAGASGDAWAYPWTVEAGTLTDLGVPEGVVRFGADGTTGVSARIGYVIPQAKNPTLYVKWAQATTVAATRRIGLADNGASLTFGSVTDPQHGLYFRHTAGGNIIAVARSSAVESILDTGIPAADGVYHTGRLVITGTTSVGVYLDGALKGNLTANIPAGVLKGGAGSTAILNSTGLLVDYFVQRGSR